MGDDGGEDSQPEPEPAQTSTGDPKIDALIQEKDRALGEIRRLNDSIDDGPDCLGDQEDQGGEEDDRHIIRDLIQGVEEGEEHPHHRAHRIRQAAAGSCPAWERRDRCRSPLSPRTGPDIDDPDWADLRRASTRPWRPWNAGG